MPVPGTPVVGTPNSGTGTVTYALPSHNAGDILKLVIECSDSAGVTAPSGGWARMTNSPRAQGSNVTCINVLWLRASSSSTTNPAVANPGNHQIGVAIATPGCITSGNPWDFTPVGSGAASSTAISATNGTTTVGNTRTFVAVADSLDTTGDQITSAANATLTGFTQLEQEFTTAGNGGGIGVWSGTRTTTGSTGTTTATVPSSTWSALVFSLVGASVTSVTVAGATHAHTVGSPTVVQVHVLAAAGATHGHTATSPTVTRVYQIAPNNAAHAHTAESPTVWQWNYEIAPNNATHAHTAQSPTMGVHITPSNATHGHAAGSPTVTLVVEVEVEPASATHNHAATSPTVSETHTVTPDDATHAHTATSPTLVHVGPPPPERTITVEADNRTIVVEHDNRTLLVEADTRTILVELEDRTVLVEADNRTITA